MPRAKQFKPHNPVYNKAMDIVKANTKYTCTFVPHTVSYLDISFCELARTGEDDKSNPWLVVFEPPHQLHQQQVTDLMPVIQ